MQIIISITKSLVCGAASLLLSTTAAIAERLPDPLPLEAATQFAIRHRTEIAAANARAEALAQRPAIVGALEDPMVSPSVDHYPFKMMEAEESSGRRFDWNVTLEQRFPIEAPATAFFRFHHLEGIVI